MVTRALLATVTLLAIASPAFAQVTPLTEQAFTMITIVGDVDANKSLGWL